ncbi:MAG: cbb3-type cytochrome oxidase assembly protein CcoS [Xanthomonadaceae bacterium]|jgi:cbb3-type cytochrome oxidase maturation protein|nr:cbb3-type cytochrome oxidase assembly protein CcoS [Xanthomonadaceae bacterium]
MTILLLLIPISLVMVGIAIGAFIWAVRCGQFDDLETPALDILNDDEPDTMPPANQSATSTARHDTNNAV